jgi:DNA-binding MarR family transcriptional regulator
VPPAADHAAPAVADRLHSAAIRLLRRLRLEDDATGLSAARLSALSVVVFGGPVALTALARAERVKPPTMTRLVIAMEEEGLLTRTRDTADGRVVRIRATPKGTRILQEGRRRRVATLARELGRLPAEDRALLLRAAGLMEAIAMGEVARP